MTRQNVAIELQGLADPANGFDARFLAAANLHTLAWGRPDTIDGEAIDVMQAALTDASILRQRQAYFLCREVAQALTLVYAGQVSSLASDHALAVLKDVIRLSAGPSLRAATEALGSLPVRLALPLVEPPGGSDIPTVGWEELAASCGIIARNNGTRCLGRSLVTPIPGTGKVLAIKFGTTRDTPETLAREPAWMELLRSSGYPFPDRFEIPSPLSFDGSSKFYLKNPPKRPSGDFMIHPEQIAVGFVAAADYFCYPNQPAEEGVTKPLSFPRFLEVMRQNSRLLGFLAGRGIIHTAPIPLFHNRVQQERRNDQGVYDWPLAGRLDRWLASCRYPNFGITGIRDFEHFETLTGANSRLFWYVGMHFLSLLLVAASFFRNQAPDRLGRDRSGKPMDSRDLFDRGLLGELVAAIFRGYYQGFTGEESVDELPLDSGRLVERMIEEMGIDRHMEEVLRRKDQQNMDKETFRNFLRAKGMGEKEISGLVKGARDIPVLTGPHLGGFNQSISLPEIIDAVAAMAASCIVGRHRIDQAS